MSNILVIAEQDQGLLKLASLSALSFASKIATSGGSLDVLLLGHNISAVAEQLRGYGAQNILVADHEALKNPLADKYAHVIANVAKERKVSIIVGAASTFSKDILPRVAGLLDAGMVSDVIDVSTENQELTFKRVLFAGNALAWVKLEGDVKVITVRGSAFKAPTQNGSASSIVPISVAESPSFQEYLGRDTKVAGRPDSTEAKIVVSGGRAIKNREDFEKLIGGLADTLGGAVGSSRALVDAGITDNALQIGQTGKVVAPDLYFAIGISGAIQHLAGMKDSKVIVAINKDAECPIFEIADYRLVGDAYQVVPELIQKVRKC
jgi:electron transfer flavoprotein alpha subunit